MHSVRILLTVVLIPFWFRIIHDYVPSGTAAFGTVAELPFDGAIILAALRCDRLFVAWKLHIPLYFLIGPMVVCALVHAFGLTSARPPESWLPLPRWSSASVSGAGSWARG